MPLRPTLTTSRLSEGSKQEYFSIETSREFRFGPSPARGVAALYDQAEILKTQEVVVIQLVLVPLCPFGAASHLPQKQGSFCFEETFLGLNPKLARRNFEARTGLHQLVLSKAAAGSFGADRSRQTGSQHGVP